MLLQIGDTQVERYLPQTNACWPPLDEDVIAIVKSPAHYLKNNYI